MIRNNKATSKSVLVTVIVVVVVICVTAGFIAYQFKPLAPYENSPTPSPTVCPTATPTPTENPTVQPTITPSSSPEKLSIQAVQYDHNGNVLTILAQTTSETSAISGIIVKNSSGNTVAAPGISSISPSTSNNVLAMGTLYSIQSTMVSLTSGTYTVTLTTVGGSSFVSPSFVIS